LISISALFLILNTTFTNIGQSCNYKTNKELFLQQHYNNAQQTGVSTVLNLAIAEKNVDENIKKWLLQSAESSRIKIMELMDDDSCKKYNLLSQLFILISFLLNSLVVYFTFSKKHRA